jgi:hypothetical protein
LSTYEAPELTILGSIAELTAGNGPGDIDKGGSTAQVP